MSKYPKWWDTTVTIYNKFQDPQTDLISWHRTVVTDCFWKYKCDKVVIGDTILDSNSIICRIPKDERYLPKYQWEQIPNDQMNFYFTLGLNDIIIQGYCEDEIDEYKNGHRSSDLIDKFKKLQGCLLIEYTVDNTGVARNDKHYLVKGI